MAQGIEQIYLVKSEEPSHLGGGAVGAMFKSLIMNGPCSSLQSLRQPQEAVGRRLSIPAMVMTLI